MFDISKLWDRWLSEGEEAERPMRDGDYDGRVEPPITGQAGQTDIGPALAPITVSPEGDLPDATLWTPRLLTV